MEFPFGAISRLADLPPVTLTKPIHSEDLLNAVRRYCD
jgi:hypothetical protein